MPRLRDSSPRLACLTALLGLLAGCKPEAPKVTPPPPIVEIANVLQRDEPITQEWIGTLDGFVNAQIRAQVTGYLLKQAYLEGTSVKKGDLLFEIDPRTFQAAFSQSKANFDKAELDLKRASTLANENAASIQDRDNAQHAFEGAQAALEATKLNLDFTHITSPVDGIAGIATAQIGDLVGPSSGILTTVSTVDPIKVYFSISEQSYLEFKNPKADQPKFPEEMEFELILADNRTYPLKGKFFSADRQIDPNTGTLRIAATFPNPDFLLRPGQYGRVRATIRTVKGAMLVPQRAVSELQGAYQIATVDSENKAHVHTVKLGNRVGSLWLVESGISPSDRIVVEGVQKAREGVVVNPQTKAAASAPASGASPVGAASASSAAK